MGAAQALLAARLFYSAGTWHRPESLALVDKVRRRVCSKLLAVRVELRVPDQLLFTVAGMLGTSELSRLRRLRCLGRLLA